MGQVEEGRRQRPHYLPTWTAASGRRGSLAPIGGRVEIVPVPPPVERLQLGLRTVALFEAAKGLLVLTAGSGLLLLVHQDVEAVAERLLEHLHLNPAHHYPRIFLQIATSATPGRLRLIAVGALIYALIRLTEAAGLWHAKRWAEWLGVVTGLVYVPFEVFALVRRLSIGPAVALVANIGIVGYLAWALSRRQRAEVAAATKAS